MKKNNVKKNNVNNAEVNNVNIDAINATKYSCNMFESDVVNDHIITIDNSKINKIDVMSMSRIAFFRKLVMLDTNFNTLAIYDYRFYHKTNDRSNTRKQEKLNNLLAYSRMRTKKQLADVLKETAIVTYLNSKYNSKSYFTVNQYIDTVK